MPIPFVGAALTPLLAFIEGNTAGDRPIYTLAGWIASGEKWHAFSKAWKAALQTPPSIRRFNLQEFIAGQGEFASFSEEARKKKIRNLLGVIEEHELVGIGSTLSESTFEKFLAEHNLNDKIISENRRIPNPFRSPYFFLGYALMVRALPQLYANGISDKINFIFNDHVAERANLEQLANDIQRWKANMSGPIAQMVCDSPSFLNDREAVPLQAASLHAGTIGAVKGYEQAGWQTVWRQDTKIRNLQYHWTEELMEAFIASTRQSLRAAVAARMIPVWHVRGP
jgi:hypothetical protein